MTEQRAPSRWLVLVVRVPADPSRHRVAVWRELRRVGALSLGQGAWVVPDAPVFADGVARVVELARRGGGEVLVLDAAGRAQPDAARLEALFTAERAEEWAEFLADCDKFDAEIDKEIRTRKFTLAELEEEEQSLERLRRWHRAITALSLIHISAALRRPAGRLHRAGLPGPAPDVTPRSPVLLSRLPPSTARTRPVNPAAGADPHVDDRARATVVAGRRRPG